MNQPLRRLGTVLALEPDPAADTARLVLDAGVAVQVRTTVDPVTLTDDDVAGLRATLDALGVRDHVLQVVRTMGARPEYAQALAASSTTRGTGASAR